MTVKQKVYSIISEQLGIPINKIKDNQLVSKNLGANSLDMIELIMSLEEEFDINIDEKQIPNTDISVWDLTKIVEQFVVIKKSGGNNAVKQLFSILVKKIKEA